MNQDILVSFANWHYKEGKDQHHLTQDAGIQAHLRTTSGKPWPCSPWGRHSRSCHMCSYTSDLTCSRVIVHCTHRYLKNKEWQVNCQRLHSKQNLVERSCAHKLWSSIRTNNTKVAGSTHVLRYNGIFPSSTTHHRKTPQGQIFILQMGNQRKSILQRKNATVNNFSSGNLSKLWVAPTIILQLNTHLCLTQQDLHKFQCCWR